MKHAGGPALDRLEPLLARVRDFSELTEKSRGVFYRRGTAFLHFHEDPAGLFADVRATAEFERLRVDADRGEDLLRRLAAVLELR